MTPNKPETATQRDPAVEAARRACSYPIDDQELNHTGSCLVSSAREALRPIRELHKPFVVRSLDDEQWHECESCHGSAWPCATARLVYSAEELS